MNINEVVTLDFETYFDAAYSLRAKKYNTSAYIRDEQFEAQICSIKEGKKKAKCFHGASLKEKLKSIDWANRDLLCHHAHFDGMILAHHFGIVPRTYLCTLSMSRALHAEHASKSLGEVGKLYELGGKYEDGEVLNEVKGYRLDEIMQNKDLFKKFCAYCDRDVELTFDIFREQIKVYPVDELRLIDLTVRMFTTPVFRLNVPRCEVALNEAIRERQTGIAVGCSAAGLASEKDLTSNLKFVAALKKLGVDAPTKLSKYNGKITYALSENDEDFVALLEHESRDVVRLVQGRFAAKSTIGETRAARLLEAGANDQAVPVYLNYYGAKTGRWSGGNKLNFQNFPRSSELRKSIIAPDGHVIVVCDSAQIEARGVNWVADNQGMLDVFKNKGDPYCHTASIIYGRTISKADKDERFIGKICLAEGTLIYSDRGWIEIQTLQPTDKLWDGDNWVCHSGLVMNGSKETLQLSGLWLTPDHLVWSGTEWKEAQSLEHDANGLSLALATAAASSPSQAISEGREVVFRRLSLSAAVDHQNTRWISITSKNSKALDAMFAPSKRLLLNATGSMLRLCRKTITGRDYLTVSRRLLPGVIQPLTNNSYIMEHGELRCLTLGEKIVLNSLRTYERLLGGIARNLSWIEWTLTKGMNPETFDLSPAPSMREINGVSPTLRRKCDVYDILSVGPKNRFLALTKNGPLFVHNCALGLGYGMGAAKFQTTLALGTMGPAVDMSLSECDKIVRKFRKANSAIQNYWAAVNGILRRMSDGEEGEYGCLTYDSDGIWLPNGMGLLYPGLTKTTDENNRTSYKYWSKTHWSKLYGGLVTENIVQALAGVIIRQQMLWYADWLKTQKLRKGEIAQIATMTHDEIVSVIPERLAESALKKKIEIMCTSPDWCSDMPLGAEGGYAKEYSK